VSHSTPSPLDPQIVATLPHIFVDRSLGAIQVPRMLRAAGLTLTTLREYYGEQHGQRVSDREWIQLTAQCGWIAFHKDAEVRRNVAERQTVIDHGARMFCVPRADITAADLAARFMANISAIAVAAQADGPFIYSVQSHRIVRLL
jgi:PIN like domain